MLVNIFVQDWKISTFIGGTANTIKEPRFAHKSTRYYIDEMHYFWRSRPPLFVVNLEAIPQMECLLFDEFYHPD